MNYVLSSYFSQQGIADVLVFIVANQYTILLTGFRDAGEQERSVYGPGVDIDREVGDTWAALAPLYRQLHAFVRARLSRHYAPPHRIQPTAPIPAHLLGNF